MCNSLSYGLVAFSNSVRSIVALAPPSAQASLYCIAGGGAAAAVCLVMGLFFCSAVDDSSSFVANQPFVIFLSKHYFSRETTLEPLYGLSSARCFRNWLDLCSSD